jgi:hypothetical protein
MDEDGGGGSSRKRTRKEERERGKAGASPDLKWTIHSQSLPPVPSFFLFCLAEAGFTEIAGSVLCRHPSRRISVSPPSLSHFLLDRTRCPISFFQSVQSRVRPDCAGRWKAEQLYPSLNLSLSLSFPPPHAVPRSFFFPVCATAVQSEPKVVLSMLQRDSASPPLIIPRGGWYHHYP